MFVFQETWKMRQGRWKVICDLHRHTQTEGPEKNEKHSFHYRFCAGQLGSTNNQEKEDFPRRGLLSDTETIFQDTDAKMKE